MQETVAEETVGLGDDGPDPVWSRPLKWGVISASTPDGTPLEWKDASVLEAEVTKLGLSTGPVGAPVEGAMYS